MKQKNILLVPSNNGYGHLRRLSSLLPEFVENGVKPSIVWDRRIPFPKDLFANYNFDLIQLNTPLNFDGPFVRCDANYDNNELKRFVSSFDAVIADGVSWPLKMSERAFCTSHFLWDLYYLRKENNKTNWLESLAQLKSEIVFFSMRDFVWEEIFNLGVVKELPVLDYWNLRPYSAKRNDDIVHISSGIKSNKIDNVYKNSNSILNSKKIYAVENYVKDGNSCPTAVICRGGLGAITESISMKSVLIFLPDDDLEIKENMNKCLGSGFALKVEQISGNLENDMQRLTQKRNEIEWPEVLSMSSLAKMILGEL